MALEKNVVYRQQIDEFGSINVLAVTQYIEDGDIVSFSNHRHVVHPGKIKDGDDPVTKEIAKVVHTPAVIATHEERVAAALAEMEDENE